MTIKQFKNLALENIETPGIRTLGLGGGSSCSNSHNTAPHMARPELAQTLIQLAHLLPQQQQNQQASEQPTNTK